MQNTNAKIIQSIFLDMISYMKHDPKRIQHFTKVYTYAKLLGQMEQLDWHSQFILECAAILHDIGIREGELLYQRNDGEIQEKLGPTEAKKILNQYQISYHDKEKICYLIGHHHSYQDISNIELQLLIEADFLVNLYEDNSVLKAIQTAFNKIIKTKSGQKLFLDFYSINE